MSRMTKFLKQTCLWQKMVIDEEGHPVLNLYGDPTYEEPIKLKCRRERTLKDVITATGAVKRSDTTYYVDQAYEVSMGDLFDGKQIIAFSEYINEHGEVEGYMVVV